MTSGGVEYSAADKPDKQNGNRECQRLMRAPIKFCALCKNEANNKKNDITGGVPGFDREAAQISFRVDGAKVCRANHACIVAELFLIRNVTEKY